MEGRSGALLSKRERVEGRSLILTPKLANIVVSRGHSRWCPAYVESEQERLNTSESDSAAV